MKTMGTNTTSMSMMMSIITMVTTVMDKALWKILEKTGV